MHNLKEFVEFFTQALKGTDQVLVCEFNHPTLNKTELIVSGPDGKKLRFTVYLEREQ